MPMFVIGLFIGCLIGVTVTALCSAFSKADKYNEKFGKNKNSRKK